MLDKSVRETNRLSISVRDFEQSMRFLRELPALYGADIEICKDTVRESLVLSAIISYARPFSRNEKDEAAKADPKITGDVLEDLSAQERTLHDKIMNLRNKAVAHSEFAFNPTKLTEEGVFVGRQFSIWTELSEEEMGQLRQLANKVMDRANHLRANKAYFVGL